MLNLCQSFLFSTTNTLHTACVLEGMIAAAAGNLPSWFADNEHCPLTAGAPINTTLPSHCRHPNQHSSQVLPLSQFVQCGLSDDPVPADCVGQLGHPLPARRQVHLGRHSRLGQRHRSRRWQIPTSFHSTHCQKLADGARRSVVLCEYKVGCNNIIRSAFMHFMD